MTVSQPLHTAAAAAWPAADVLMAGFDSLGDNCEFGLAQRAVGAEPLGLLRFASVSLPNLVAALESGLRGLDDPARIELYRGFTGEFMIRLHPFGIQYHTYRWPPAITAEELHQLEVRRVGLMRRKLLDDIARGRRIFVRRDNDGTDWRQAAALLAALRRHGEATLLWVGPADGARPPGTVEVAAPGLLRAHMGRLAPLDHPAAFSLPDWLAVCRGAWQLAQDAAAPGLAVLAPATEGQRPNLVPSPQSGAAALWYDEGAVRTHPAPPPLRAGMEAACHVLGLEAGGGSVAVAVRPTHKRVLPGAVHVASAYVWIPANFRGGVVGLVMSGLPSIRLDNARLDLRDAWQRAWVTARIPVDAATAAPGLYIQGQPGDVIYSSGWRLERGVLPGDLRDAAPQDAAPQDAGDGA